MANECSSVTLQAGLSPTLLQTAKTGFISNKNYGEWITLKESTYTIHLHKDTITSCELALQHHSHGTINFVYCQNNSAHFFCLVC